MKKLLNKKGFTLMEMLIVIAIIVILVAISIPAFSGSLDKAKIATDAANLRSARAALAMELAEGKKVGDLNGKYYYNIDTGKLVELASAPSGDAAKPYLGSCSKHDAAYIHVVSGDCAWSANGDCSE